MGMFNWNKNKKDKIPESNSSTTGSNDSSKANEKKIDYSNMDLISNDWDFDKDPNEVEEIDPVYLYDTIKPTNTAYYSAGIRRDGDYMSELANGDSFQQKTLTEADYASISGVHREQYLRNTQEDELKKTGVPGANITPGFGNNALNDYYGRGESYEQAERKTTPIFTKPDPSTLGGGALENIAVEQSNDNSNISSNQNLGFDNVTSDSNFGFNNTTSTLARGYEEPIFKQNFSYEPAQSASNELEAQVDSIKEEVADVATETIQEDVTDMATESIEEQVSESENVTYEKSYDNVGFAPTEEAYYGDEEDSIEEATEEVSEDTVEATSEELVEEATLDTVEELVEETSVKTAEETEESTEDSTEEISADDEKKEEADEIKEEEKKEEEKKEEEKKEEATKASPYGLEFGLPSDEDDPFAYLRKKHETSTESVLEKYEREAALEAEAAAEDEEAEEEVVEEIESTSYKPSGLPFDDDYDDPFAYLRKKNSSSLPVPGVEDKEDALDEEVVAEEEAVEEEAIEEESVEETVEETAEEATEDIEEVVADEETVEEENVEEEIVEESTEEINEDIDVDIAEELAEEESVEEEVIEEESVEETAEEATEDIEEEVVEEELAEEESVEEAIEEEIVEETAEETNEDIEEEVEEEAVKEEAEEESVEEEAIEEETEEETAEETTKTNETTNTSNTDPFGWFMSMMDEYNKTQDSNKKDNGNDGQSYSGSYTNGYEDVCFVCRRPESKAGKMFHLPNNISVCQDCMQRTMETVSQYDYQGMFNNISQDELDEEIKKITGGQGMPSFSFINLANLQGDGGIPNKQKLKRKNKDEKKEAPILDITKIPAPHKIREKLDEYVVGQDHAKKIMSVAVYNHYKRVACDVNDEIEIEKSNMLMIGPTGSGKTFLVKTLAKLLDVPLAIADATSLTEAGYIGDDIESVVSKLLAAADNDVERAEKGIIFIDEIDKIAKKQNANSRDVSGESVQQGMLKLLEGAEIEVPVGASSKGAMVPLATIDTKNILFICGGAFPGLDEIIKERLLKSSSMGFGAVLRDTFDKDKELLKKVKIEDIRKFGMIPEFIGRLPIIFTLDSVDKDMMIRILNEPKNAILKQYQKLLALDEVKLEFSDDAIEVIADKALEQETGARALRSIIEEFMLDIMYEIPKDENIGSVTITGDYLKGVGGPVIAMRGNDTAQIEDKSSDN